MPTNLSLYLNCSSKSFKLIIILLVFPLFFHGQTLTGLWTGAISNDSTTVRKDQSFEIALTEYKGKVYGYTRSEFIVDDVLYYVVKRVKGEIIDDVCEVVDDEIIAFNFPTKLDKGVKVTSSFRKNKSDGVWHLEGTWKTNATKKFYAVTGLVDLDEEKDLSASKIFPHLEELKLANEIAFYKEREEGIPIVKIAKPERKETNAVKIDEDPAVFNGTVSTIKNPEANNTIAIAKDKELASIKNNSEELLKTNTNKNIEEEAIVKNSTPDNKSIANSSLKNNTDSNFEKTSNIAAINNNSENEQLKKESQPIAKTELKGSEIITTETKEVANNTVNPELNKEATIKKPAIIATKESNTVETAKGTLSEKPKQVIAAVTEPVVVAKKSATVVAKENSITETTKVTVPEKPKQVTTPANIPTVVAKKTDNSELNKEVATKKPVVVATKENNIPETAKVTMPAEPAITEAPISREELIAPAAVVLGRKSEFTQLVNYKSDSLVLSLYDNGEIDGDTVSVFMNGEILMEKQGLKASAIKKTIYISRDAEDFTLVLFAENLGKYPPNTGLLVVRDGDDVYNLRFSSDFQKNAGIVFRRKR